MTPFDVEEYERWSRAARDELAQADVLRAAAHHHGAVLHAEQAAQLALKGLLRGVGEPAAAWGHGLVRLVERGQELAALEISDDARAALLWLEREYLPTRDPDALSEGVPSEKYAASDSARARAAAEAALAAVRAAWAALQEALSQQRDVGGHDAGGADRR